MHVWIRGSLLVAESPCSLVWTSAWSPASTSCCFRSRKDVGPLIFVISFSGEIFSWPWNRRSPFINTRFRCAPWRTIPCSLCRCLFCITTIKVNYQYDTLKKVLSFTKQYRYDEIRINHTKLSDIIWHLIKDRWYVIRKSTAVDPPTI
jgi:hypothetical protein